MLQHADWQRKAYTDKFKLVSDILEFAARVGGESHEIEDTSREKARTPPEPEGPPDEVPPPPPPPPPRSLPLLVEEVDGDPRDPLINQAKSMGHHIVTRASHVFCKRCACYATTCWLARKHRCKPGSLRTLGGRLSRLWDGRHPTTGHPL